MRTNIEIDDALMAQALKAGPYKTKKEAVEAGLKLLARQAAYREILKWEGKLKWEGDESIDWTRPPAEADALAHAHPGASRYATTVPGAPLVAAEPGPGSDDGRR
jgi:Arc/MetJ family transcription regulator